MATLDNQVPANTETLNLDSSVSQSIDGDNPAGQPLLATPEDIGQEPSIPLSTDDSIAGEKRKRNDPSLNPLWKTSLCSYFRSNSGVCSHGDECRYAHGEEELRQRPDNTWDPTSERAKKVAKLENIDKCKEEESKDEDVLMTEVVVDDDGECTDPELSKCLVHLPRKWNSDNLKKFLDEQGVVFKSAKKKKGMLVGFVSFDNEEQLKTALEEFEGKTFGNKNLKVANVIPRSFDKKIKMAMSTSGDIGVSCEVEGADVNSSNSAPDGSVASSRSARDAVTPLAHMPYEDQLEQKKASLTQILKKLTRNARKACPDGVSLPEWILKSRDIGGLPCELEGVVASPLVNGYRNKCEFSVGYSLDGKPTVGFMLGNFRAGVTAVEEPTGCPNVSEISCRYAMMFQEFLQQTGLPLWNRFKNTGFWRQLTVREGRTPVETADSENSVTAISEVMLIVQICSTGTDDALVSSELEKLAQVFAAGAATNSPSLPLTALVVQDHQGISNVAPADAPLRTLPVPKAENSPVMEETNDVVEARIHDHICNLKFCISPTAFFQVNTVAAEKLYSLAGDWANLGPDTLLFDVCCGTGTIGLTLAHRVGMVVGIEMNASAVQDAYRNAEINGIKNCKFVSAKAEDVMGALLKEYVGVTHKQEVENTPENNDKDISTPDQNDSSTKQILSPVEGADHELQDVKSTSESLKNGGLELGTQPKQDSTKEDGDTPTKKFSNVVAIVDPPRVGLHPIVIKALRTHPNLRRLVYISCNPESLVANAIELCTPAPNQVDKSKNNRAWRKMSSAGLARHRAKSMPNSEPFRPVKAIAVDLFPHTQHCEMVMLLER